MPLAFKIAILAAVCSVAILFLGRTFIDPIWAIVTAWGRLVSAVGGLAWVVLAVVAMIAAAVGVIQL